MRSEADPKVSIITVVRNNVRTIRDCIESVLSQTYPVEYIVIDGCSTDGTSAIIEEYKCKITRIVTEPDDGLYDAMNKGIRLATGDIVGILNSDDFYSDATVIETVVHEFVKRQVDSVFADLVFVASDDTKKIIRYYDCSNFSPDRFAYGWMPAHTAFFVKRGCYEQFGLYKTNYSIAADYELLVRFLWKHRLSYCHIPRVIIKMRTGGISTRNLRSNWILNQEIVRACAENGLRTNLWKVYSKYFMKIFQLVRRPQ